MGSDAEYWEITQWRKRKTLYNNSENAKKLFLKKKKKEKKRKKRKRERDESHMQKLNRIEWTRDKRERERERQKEREMSMVRRVHLMIRRQVSMESNC